MTFCLMTCAFTCMLCSKRLCIFTSNFGIIEDKFLMYTAKDRWKSLWILRGTNGSFHVSTLATLRKLQYQQKCFILDPKKQGQISWTARDTSNHTVILKLLSNMQQKYVFCLKPKKLGSQSQCCIFYVHVLTPNKNKIHCLKAGCMM